ncbi:hypothetical protein BDZ97DRAFT_1755568 [Flammula alnicola]|nr:hypothetical protein BDZ97DRAFT_1755568 [Flammula alnicola]
MASPATGPALAERADIHKSCKSIETLLNILNEYCEAAGAVVALQKKLGKSLRDTAGLKVTGEIAANAMHASATIFEALSDVDSKFAKVADKEYEFVSTEVKKWFKKLAKEERNHDERMASANARIKQAGQVYEKKSKRKAADVGEEHARYINLISTLGPEVSQDKYNHALNVTQRHTTTTYNVAACLSRLADSEWQKSCECVRRFSPTVGPLGQWKALCEGGWTGPVPSDLPDFDAGNGKPTSNAENEGAGLKPIQEESQSHPKLAAATLTPEPRESLSPSLIPLPGYSTGPPSASASSQDLTREQQPSSRNSPTLAIQNLPLANKSTPVEISSATIPTSIEPHISPFVDLNTGSVRSLSAFPSPPTHFPLPPPRQPQPQQSSVSRSIQSSSSNLKFPSSVVPLSESPVSAHSDLEEPSFGTADQNFREANNPSSGPNPSAPSPDRRFGERLRTTEEQMDLEPPSASPTFANETRRPLPIKSQTSLPSESIYQRNRDISTRKDILHGPSSSVDIKSSNTKYNRGHYEEESREFGVMNSTIDMSSKSRTVEGTKYARPLERTDTGTSNGSIVAAMRNRYSNPGSTSPPPRELPRIPLSVNDLASRYQPADAPLSPRARAGSPPVMRQQSLPLIDTAARQVKQEPFQDRISPSGQNISSAEDERRRWQQQERSEQLAENERRAKEQEIRERERELDARVQDLERDRARLQSLREEEGTDPDEYRAGSAAQTPSGQFILRPRERRTSLRHQLQRPKSQIDLGDVADAALTSSPKPSSPTIGTSNLRQKSQYSYSATHLVPPVTSASNTPSSVTQPLASPRRSQDVQPPSPRPRAEPQYESHVRDRYPDHAEYNSNTSSTNTSGHASNCGCESCSVSKYRASGTSGLDQRQPHQRVDSKPEKPKGWMRRLSMPVGNAFGLDSSKKHQSNNSASGATTNFGLGSGIGYTPAGGSRSIFSMDGRKNASTTALNSRASDGITGGDRGLGVQEDGRLGAQARPGVLGIGRRSYEASGISNRSMTNLGLTGRR